MLYTFLVVSFSRYKRYIIFLILLTEFSHVLPALTWARAIGNLENICLGLNILTPFPCVVLLETFHF